MSLQVRRVQRREKREQAARQAYADLTTTSPRIKHKSGTAAADKLRDYSPSDTGTPPPRPPPSSHAFSGAGAMTAANGLPMIDPYASCAEGEEALCAVCGDGLSEEPNRIVFCDRCDVGVHQRCYGVTTIPEGDWLCWPCREHEAELRKQGKSQQEIRPPRYMLAAGGGQAHEGGSTSVQCCLCPVRHGAFKRTGPDTRPTAWCHLVCALWNPETYVKPDAAAPLSSGGGGEERCEVIMGVNNIKPERLGTPCAVCHLAVGSVVKCAYGHCAAAFHPLCARQAGW